MNELAGMIALAPKPDMLVCTTFAALLCFGLLCAHQENALFYAP